MPHLSGHSDRKSSELLFLQGVFKSRENCRALLSSIKDTVMFLLHGTIITALRECCKVTPVISLIFFPRLNNKRTGCRLIRTFIKIRTYIYKYMNILICIFSAHVALILKFYRSIFFSFYLLTWQIHVLLNVLSFLSKKVLGLNHGS